ncbi:MAG: PIN domain-containing protein [Acidimicrobiales bacterium]
MSARYLIDNSVIQRLHRSAEVRAARDRLMRSGDLAVCLPTLLEACFSARSHEEHQAAAEGYLSGWMILAPAPEILNIALRVQSELFRAGKGRSVGVSDLQIAATALHHDAEDRPVVVVHYDADFDHIRSVEPALKASWVVPKGTVA